MFYLDIRMTPLLFDELPQPLQKIEDILLYGTLPNIITESSAQDRESDLYSYVQTYTNSQTKRRLIKSPKYLFFDLGIRRACANEGIRLPRSIIGNLFEHYIGNELIYQSQLVSPQIKVRYWRDSAGPEVDFVLDSAHQYIPIEVKWTDKPKTTDARHLIKLIDEHESAEQGYVVCRTPHRYRLAENILALPWQELKEVFTSIRD